MTTITVKEYKDKGKWGGTIIDAQGSWYGVPPSLTNGISPGSQYAIKYNEVQGKGAGAGKTFKEITEIAPLIAGPAKVAMNGYGNNIGAAVMGMVNQFIGRGDVANDPDSIAAQIDRCLEAYHKSGLGK